MFHRLWTLIRKELQSLLREPQTRAILIMPVLIQVLLFPFAATLEVTNATIAIYNEDSGRHAVELTQRFARAKAFTHVLLLQSPQAIQPTIDEQKALLVVRFPADFSRNLDNYQTAPLQLLLDGRNSNSAQIAANYLQQIVKNYQQELLEGKAKPNNSELVVRNWYNPSAGDWYLGLSDPVCRLAAAVLFHHGDLRSIAGGLWLIDFVAVRHPAAGVYRRVRLYDAGYSPVGVRLTSGKHAAVAAGSDLDKSHPPLYRYHQANLSEGCESGDCVGKFVAATGHSGHHRLSGVCDVPKEDCVIPVIVQTTTALAFLTHPSRIVIYASGDSLRCRLVVARTL